MKKRKADEMRKDVLLRKMYESGELTSNEFLEKLFSTREADRRRRNIIKKNKKIRSQELQRV